MVIIIVMMSNSRLFLNLLTVLWTVSNICSSGQDTITSRTVGAYHVQQVVCHVVWMGTAVYFIVYGGRGRYWFNTRGINLSFTLLRHNKKIERKKSTCQLSCTFGAAFSDKPGTTFSTKQWQTLSSNWQKWKQKNSINHNISNLQHKPKCTKISKQLLLIPCKPKMECTTSRMTQNNSYC